MGYYTVATAAYVETVDNSETWTFPRFGDPSAQVSFWVPGAKVWDVMAELFTPLQHPMFPFLYVQNVQMSQLGKGVANGHVLAHERCQLEVTYAPWERSFSEKVTNQAQMITLPKWRFRWNNGRMLADGEEPSRIIRTQKITHSYTFLQNPPTWLYEDIGKVNSTQIITSSGLVCEPETLLYEGGEADRTWNPWGTKGWQMSTNFSYNPNGWNRWYNTIAGEWLTFQTWEQAENVKPPEGEEEQEKEQEQEGNDDSGTTSTGQWVDFKMYELADLTTKFYYSGIEEEE